MANVYVNARSAPFDSGSPVQDVLVSLRTLAGAPLASDTTNSSGLAYLGARAAGSYEIHIAVPTGVVARGGAIQRITVTDDPTQVFDVLVDAYATTVPSDGHLCRCDGYFVDSFGRPVPDVSISFREDVLPQLLYYESTGISSAVVPSTLTVRTDKRGYATVDLLRNYRYCVTMSGFENISRVIFVPDLQHTNLPDVLFPYIDRVEYWQDGNALAPTNAPEVALTAGEHLALTTDIVFRSGFVVHGTGACIFTSSDDTVVTCSLTDTGLSLQAVGPGTATVQVTRREAKKEDQTGIHVSPDTAVVGSLGVVVSA